LPRDRSLIKGKLSATMPAEHTAVQATTVAPSNGLIGSRSVVSPRTGANWSGIRSRSESTSQGKLSQNTASPNTLIPRSNQPSNAPLAAQLVASRGTIARTVDSKDQILERLPALLDGSRHTDELCTMFRLSWKELERKLIEVGEGEHYISMNIILVVLQGDYKVLFFLGRTPPIGMGVLSVTLTICDLAASPSGDMSARVVASRPCPKPLNSSVTAMGPFSASALIAPNMRTAHW